MIKPLSGQNNNYFNYFNYNYSVTIIVTAGQFAWCPTLHETLAVCVAVASRILCRLALHPFWSANWKCSVTVCIHDQIWQNLQQTKNVQPQSKNKQYIFLEMSRMSCHGVKIFQMFYIQFGLQDLEIQQRVYSADKPLPDRLQQKSEYSISRLVKQAARWDLNNVNCCFYQY